MPNEVVTPVGVGGAGRGWGGVQTLFRALSRGEGDGFSSVVLKRFESAPGRSRRRSGLSGDFSHSTIAAWWGGSGLSAALGAGRDVIVLSGNWTRFGGGISV